MKNIIFIAIILAGCGGGARKTLLLLDPATGCQYVATTWGESFSDPNPDLRIVTDSAGKPICGKH